MIQGLLVPSWVDNGLIIVDFTNDHERLTIFANDVLPGLDAISCSTETFPDVAPALRFPVHGSLTAVAA